MKDFKFKINGNAYEAQVEEQGNGTLQVTLNGKKINVELPETASDRPVIRPVVAPVAGAAPMAARPAQAGGPASIASPLPGTIIDVKVKAGQKVKCGDVLIVMEAMKMANDIVAEADGTIKSVNVKKGDNVNQGDILIEMEADATAPVAAPAPAAAAAPVASGNGTVAAPLPGTITEVKVSEGQKIKRGDVVVIMEAMKMANDIVAEVDGTVKKIYVKQGAQVQSGEPLVEIA